MKKIIFITLCCLFISSGFATNLSAEQELNQILLSIKSMQANFVETLSSGSQENTPKIYGKMFCDRPGKFRWEVARPNAQLIIADQNYVWIYDIDLEQVVKKQLDYRKLQTPALLLSGAKLDLEKNFIVKKIFREQQETKFKLTPKFSDSYQNIILHFNANILLNMEINDNIGGKIKIAFKNTVVNIPLATTLFRLKLPKNVDIIN